ncbi:THAP domain-containing protein 10-like [Cyprinus carpio]|uniref:THAP domain-containing protein 10-like n=1 Tax=Cyprinus carpio TaxID=7962 RepID=A0A9Q9X9R3_CYPCA|nr:THAP domain-containing protein 10-like [Cyprinus carpio]
MVNYCVCAGCKNSTQTGHRVHGFPMKDKATLRQWVQFVRVRWANFSMTSITTNSKICSTHFREEDYDPGDIRMVSLGLKRLSYVQLIPTTVPSVHTHLSACPAPRPRSTNIGATRRKRELAKMLTDASMQETADSVGAMIDDPLPSSSTCDTVTQCNLKPPGMSHAVQVNLKPKMVSVGTQMTFRMQTSTPLTSPEQTDEEEDPSVIISDLKYFSWCAMNLKYMKV